MEPTIVARMRFTQQYMDDVKVKLGISSDYALAKHLGVSKTTVSNYRNGSAAFSPRVCRTVARILDVPDGVIAAAASIDRSQDDQEAKTWHWVYTQLRSIKAAAQAGVATVWMLCALAVGALSMASPSAAHAGQQASACDGLYIMFSRLITAAHRWCAQRLAILTGHFPIVTV